MRGGERCLEVFCELFPDADLFTLLHCRGTVSEVIERMRIQTSFVQHLPLVERFYRHYLPLFPSAIERFDFRGYDLIFSTSHCVAKGAIRPPEALHISYIHTPMRYAWDLYQAYFGDRLGPVKSLVVPRLMAYLRRWDLQACERVDHFVANSHHVAARVKRHYGKEAAVIHPPVDTDRFQPAAEDGDYYLVVSALVPYKRIDLAIQACNRLKRPLKVVGWGPEEGRLQKLAGPTVEFLGRRSDAELAHLYARCRALIFPGEEDFGIVPLEAQAAGRPVIAYGKGGVLETVIPINPADPRSEIRDRGGTTQPIGPPSADREPTGIFFYEQTDRMVAEAVRLFEQRGHRFPKQRLRDHALTFDRGIFKAKFRTFIEDKWQAFQQDSRSRLPRVTSA
ncbi:MAG: glycosyltransferase [Nitrospinae bacterium]|nr:glycosyltransferase [Nitrospinota bacterium]